MFLGLAFGFKVEDQKGKYDAWGRTDAVPSVVEPLLDV